MRDGLRIIDADRHVLEPFEMWREYLEPELRDHAVYLDDEPRESVTERVRRLGAHAMVPLAPMPRVNGRPLFNKMSERAWLELSLAAYGQIGQRIGVQVPRSHLEILDRSGIDVAFLFPTYALLLLAFDDLDPVVASAYARAYNTWLRDYCSVDPRRMQGVGVISPHDPRQMVPELHRVIGFGWKAVVLRPNPVKGRKLDDPAYEPFWAACERASVAVAIHEGTHAHLPAAGSDRFTTRFALHACSHPMEQMMALLTLIEGGVLERHPGLRVAFLEAGCGWLPYWLWRLDELEYRSLRGEVADNVRRKPSEYFRRQCYVGVEPDEPYLAEIIRFIGEDRLLFGTDFPHPEHGLGIVDEALALRDRLPEGVLHKLLWDNAARFYGLE
ncbi:hypothetical protein SOCEGT47_043210 [Sorangium cellulosum]|jgi:predicted TIM-barrel fold metal-dependent hydrolase|uniref:Amidohydrolase-related domain-containing protein n=1 Tax=Sorangium cellulosum TaxID=56 RepID=A0A4P2Q3R4_SORCE|nr:amidohydrolase family protein [Sorangium cellulosum]AUX23791.1 hypothetical protein SOCEGT47_043210 [Sorangium cellulosum]